MRSFLRQAAAFGKGNWNPLWSALMQHDVSKSESEVRTTKRLPCLRLEPVGNVRNFLNNL